MIIFYYPVLATTSDYASLLLLKKSSSLLWETKGSCGNEISAGIHKAKVLLWGKEGDPLGWCGCRINLTEYRVSVVNAYKEMEVGSWGYKLIQALPKDPNNSLLFLDFQVLLRTSLKNLRAHIPLVSGCVSVWQGHQARNFFEARLQRLKSLLLVFFKTEIWYISNSYFVWFIWLAGCFNLHSLLSLIIMTFSFGSRLGCNLAGLVNKELWFVL